MLSGIPRRLNDARLGLHYAARQPHFFLIQGMHRSGTSCVARALNLMGASLGPAEGQTVGGRIVEVHWEAPEVNWINEEILVRSGGNWSRPPETLRVTRRDYWRCRRALWDFGGHRCAVLKDPRIALTYDIWKAVLPAHSMIVCLRHPLNVARSLEKRDAIALAEGVELWRVYNERVLRIAETSGQVYWFDFDEGRDAVESLVTRIAADFKLSGVEEAVRSYDAGQRHHRAADDASLPADVAGLYNEIRQRCAAAARSAPGPAALQAEFAAS